MSDEIHARRRDGEWVYRIWSTVVDDYTTVDLTEDQMRRQTRLDAVERALDEHERHWPGWLKRAQEKDTSSRISRSQDTDGLWEKPWNPENPDA